MIVFVLSRSSLAHAHLSLSLSLSLSHTHTHTHTHKFSHFLLLNRQRYQYKLLQEKKPSTMTEERIKTLEGLGFIWDSHGSAWEERLSELKHYQSSNGHCNVPSMYLPNPSLATWVKCQRRQ